MRLFVYGLVGTAPDNHIENAAARLWFIGYLKRIPDTLLLVLFWMKQSQGQGAAILSNIYAILITKQLRWCLQYSSSSF
jgi:hypothetical protein